MSSVIDRGNKTMLFNWFDASEATKLGISLADQFAPRQQSESRSKQANPAERLHQILISAGPEVSHVRLNFYKKAKFANAFKWRLLENGVDGALADEVTQTLIVRLSSKPADPSPKDKPAAADGQRPKDAKSMYARANKYVSGGAYHEAIALYQDSIKLNPRQPAAFNNLGAALSHLGRYQEAKRQFDEAIKINPDYVDPHSNLGNMLLVKGQYAEAERYLRRALKLNPRFVDARINLALTLVFLNQLRDAKSHFEKVLKREPRNADALVGLALVAKSEGSFPEAEELLRRALRINPKMSKALASQAGLRKMTLSDGAWIKLAEEAADAGIAPLDESELRFAIGKYYDDVHDFKQAFQNYQRANDLLKPIAPPYDREVYKQFVDTMINAYPQNGAGPNNRAGSLSAKPVFVVGMPRSGTSLTEQIISSHPAASGAGELAFWSEVAAQNESTAVGGLLDEPARIKLAEAYLRILETKDSAANRVVDKAPVNADHLGLIHGIFPNARIIYMRRHPIDTCLSCYFQQFVLSMSFTINLADLAEHYRQHERLMAHWRRVLPPGSILDVPYEELVTDQAGWSRRILDFIELDWDDRVLDFHSTQRSVLTASFWQVRQKMYNGSVHRWRHYEKFIGPLLDLKGQAD